MSLAHKLLYGIGFTPWEEIAELPHVREQVTALFGHEEQGRGPPYGPVQVGAVVGPGATLLMVAWAPGRRGPLPRGASRGDIEAAYPEWQVIDEEAVDISAAPFYRLVRGADTRFYRLRRVR